MVDIPVLKVKAEKGSHHLLAYLEPVENGEVSMAIITDKAVYRFYSLEIKKVNWFSFLLGSGTQISRNFGFDCFA